LLKDSYTINSGCTSVDDHQYFVEWQDMLRMYKNRTSDTTGEVSPEMNLQEMQEFLHRKNADLDMRDQSSAGVYLDYSADRNPINIKKSD
jgi:hypothetical protein